MDRKRNTKARGKKTLRQKTSNKQNRTATDVHGQQVVVLSRYQITPPRLRVKFDYKSAFTMAGGGSAASRYFYANGAYDIDPNVGNLTLTGFNQWMALYSVFHVERVNVKITAINNETFPVRIATCWFGTSTSSFTTAQWGNEHAIEHQMMGSISGMGRTQITRSMVLRNLINGGAYDGDLSNYYGTTLSNPASLISFNIGISSPTGGALINGVTLRVEFDLITDLSHPVQLSQV